MAAQAVAAVHQHEELLLIGQADGQRDALPLAAVHETARGNTLHALGPGVMQAVLGQCELFDQAVE